MPNFPGNTRCWSPCLCRKTTTF